MSGFFARLQESASRANTDVQKFIGVPCVAGARLCNFVTNRSELQPGHEFYLSTDFKKAIETLQTPFVQLVGYASRKGNTARNQKLSEERMQAVGTYIASLGGKTCYFEKFKGVGSSQSGEDADNNEGYYRAVDVYLYGNKPAPRPEPPPEAYKNKENQYGIRVAFTGSVGFGFVQTEMLAIEIASVARSRGAKFIYVGLGITAEVPGMPPIGGSQQGKWSYFLTDRPTPLSTFHALANVTTKPGASFDKHSIGGEAYLEFINLSDGDGDIRVKASPIQLNGGPGFSPPSAGAWTGGTFNKVGKDYFLVPKD